MRKAMPVDIYILYRNLRNRSLYRSVVTVNLMLKEK